MISPEDSHSDDDVKVDDNNCEDEDDTPPKLTAQAQRELSDGAYSPRGADTPTQDLISQIERHCDGYGEKNTDQDSFIQCCWHLSMINNNKQGCKRKDNLLNLIKLGFIFTRVNIFIRKHMFPENGELTLATKLRCSYYIGQLKNTFLVIFIFGHWAKKERWGGELIKMDVLSYQISS